MSILYDSAVPFVGVGTGRCGTNSLARIVGECGHTATTHEAFQAPWYESGHEELGRLIRRMHDHAKRGIVCGEVNLVMIRHIGELRTAIRNLNVVCLHRDKESTVESFMEFGSYMLRPGDKRKWADGNYNGTRRQNAALQFPVIDAANAAQAFGFYWEFYEFLMEHVAEPVLHLNMTDLNNDSKLQELFEFLGIPESDRVYPERRVWNDRDFVMSVRRRMDNARVV